MPSPKPASTSPPPMPASVPSMSCCCPMLPSLCFTSLVLNEDTKSAVPTPIATRPATPRPAADHVFAS